MSMINDYTFELLAVQKGLELRKEADNDRLARIALSGRQPWWRRLFLRSARPAALGSTNGPSPQPARRAPRIGAEPVTR